MRSVYLVNERDTVLDMSGVLDVNGARFSLQPKGRPGASRECSDAVLLNPTVKRLLQNKWISTADSAPKEEAPLMAVITAPPVVAAVTPGTTNYPTGGPLSSPPVSDAVRPYTDNAPPYVAPSTVTDEQAEIAQGMKPDDTLEREKEMPGVSDEMIKGSPPPPPATSGMIGPDGRPLSVEAAEAQVEMVKDVQAHEDAKPTKGSKGSKHR